MLPEDPIGHSAGGTLLLNCQSCLSTTVRDMKSASTFTTPGMWEATRRIRLELQTPIPQGLGQVPEVVGPGPAHVVDISNCGCIVQQNLDHYVCLSCPWEMPSSSRQLM